MAPKSPATFCFQHWLGSKPLSLDRWGPCLNGHWIAVFHPTKGLPTTFSRKCRCLSRATGVFGDVASPPQVHQYLAPVQATWIPFRPQSSKLKVSALPSAPQFWHPLSLESHCTHGPIFLKCIYTYTCVHMYTLLIYKAKDSMPMWYSVSALS